MRALRPWLVYLFAVFLGGALLAPWLHWAVQEAATVLPIPHHIVGSPFHRYVDRAILGLALIGLWPLLRYLGVRHWSDVGWVRPRGETGRVGLGFGIGFVSLAVVAVLALISGARVWSAGAGWNSTVWTLLKAALSAVVVAILEETLFRGALYGSLRRSGGFGFALGVSSLVYAWVHFLARVEWRGDIHALTGVRVLGQMLGGFVDWRAMVPAFLNLVLAGSILAVVYERTGTLYGSMGLHGGWIFWLKSYGALTQSVPGHSEWLWGSAKLIDGWVALPVLGLTAIGVWFGWHRAGRRSHESGPQNLA